MHFVDLILIIPVLWGLYRGFMNGVIMEAATLSAFFLGTWGGIHLSDKMAALLKSWTGSESPYIPIISFSLVFVGILVIVFLTAKMVQRFVEDGIALGLVNKIAGAAFGGLKFALLLSLLLFVIDAVSNNPPLIPQKIKDESLLYKPAASLAPAIIPGLRESRLAKAIPNKDSVKVEVDVELKPGTDSVKVKPKVKLKE